MHAAVRRPVALAVVLVSACASSTRAPDAGAVEPDAQSAAADTATADVRANDLAAPSSADGGADVALAPDVGPVADAPALAHDATVFFQNQGNTKGWTVLGPAQHGGSIVDDPLAYRDSGGSVKSTCLYEPANGERFHSEPRVDGVGVHDGGDRYYGYALYLPRDWSFEGKERHVTVQFGQVLIKPNHFQHWVINDKLQMGPINGQSVTLGTISVGEWHRIVTHLRFGPQGMIEVWYDGARVVSANDSVPGGSDLKSGRGAFLYALGLYEAGWLSGNVGPMKIRSVYNAKIRVTDSMESADPAGW